MGATMGFLAYFASNNLHREALQNIFYSPMSVFETQPLGRILGVFGKDIDTIDNQLADSWRMLSMTLVSVSWVARCAVQYRLITSSLDQ